MIPFTGCGSARRMNISAEYLARACAWLTDRHVMRRDRRFYKSFSRRARVTPARRDRARRGFRPYNYDDGSISAGLTLARRNIARHVFLSLRDLSGTLI